jgi:hypothetical protein
MTLAVESGPACRQLSHSGSVERFDRYSPLDSQVGQGCGRDLGSAGHERVPDVDQGLDHFDVAAQEVDATPPQPSQLPPPESALSRREHEGPEPGGDHLG